VTSASGIAASSSSSSLSGGAIAGIVIGGLAGLLLLLCLLFVCYRGMRDGGKKKTDAEAYATHHDTHDDQTTHEEQVEMEEVQPEAGEAETDTHQADA